MKRNSHLQQTLRGFIQRHYKFSLTIIMALAMSLNGFAHRVETYTTSGCFPGQSVTVDAVITFAGANTLYQWQFRDNSGNWRCFTNGTNATTINGVTFTVSGALGGPAANNSPLLTISRTDGNIAALENVQVRVLMRDLTAPVCTTATAAGHTLTGDTWGGDDQGLQETKYLRLHVYSFAGDCGGNTPGCIGNVLTNARGFYGGFENKIYNAAGDNYTDYNFSAAEGAGSTDFTASFAEPTANSYTLHGNSAAGTSQYLVTNNPYFMNYGFTRNIAPHTGNFQLVVRGSANTTGRAWFKTVTVVPGSTYQFCVWATRVEGVTDPNVTLKVGTTEIASADLSAVTPGTWIQICGTYTVPVGTTSVVLSVSDKNGATGSNIYALDDICFRLLGSIGDKVWNDTNKNGIQDAGELGLAGVLVTLYDANSNIVASTVTDAFGNYLFSGLAVNAGGVNYQVRFSAPPGYKIAPQNADAAGISGAANSDPDPLTGRTGNITLTTAAPVASYVDAGMIYTVSARIGDFVWNDINKNGIQETGEPGISGVTVMLYNATTNALVAATITSNTGFYSFKDVPAGTYYIKVSPPIGYQVSPKDATTDNIDSDVDPVSFKSANVSVVAGTNDLTIDAGLNVTANTKAALGDRVWLDLNTNNIQDANEPGVANVTVQLYSNTNVLQATLTTDAFGYYMFNNLNAGVYYVKFTLPAGFTFVTANAGANDDLDSDPATGTGQTANIALIADQVRTNMDAGLRSTVTGTTNLGDFVWYDLNKDGLQSGAGEIGVPGITVILYNSSNVIAATTTTDKNGFYLFTGLPAATSYTVGFSNLPSGYGFSVNSGLITVTNNNDVNPATGRTATVTTGAAGTTISYVDAGLVNTPNVFDSKASVGDYVWNDLNNDGIQNANEPGVGGVTVTLYAADGTTVIATTTTNALGYYIFTNLDAGSYVIGFSGLPAGYVIGTQNAGTSDLLDSDPSTATSKTAPFTLAAGEINSTIDAAVRNAAAGFNLGDFVWYDANSNGIQDAGEPGVQGVSVALLNVNNVVVKTTTTNTAGFYLFTDLTAGTYYVQFGNLPAGYVATTKGAGTASTGSDANTATLKTDAIAFTATNLDWDLGIRSTTKGAIGDFVWNDLDRDGNQDAGEPGVSGVTVTLYNSSNVAIASTITNGSGFYFFPNLDAGTYTVGFSNLPAQSGFTGKDAVADNLDSDVDPATGKSAAVVLTAGQVNNTVDAGIVSLLAAVGNYVWTDTNSNGIQEATEAGVPGMTATLYTTGPNGTLGDADDVAVASAVTDAKGFYFINNIPVASGGSSFYVRFTDLQANNVFTLVNAPGSTAANNSDVTLPAATNGRTGLFTLSPGQVNLDVDAGLVGPGNNTLPLHHLDLSAVLHGTIVDLTWYAENEMSTNRFIIQRSTDGTNFSDISVVNVNGVINTLTRYQAPDDIQQLVNIPVIYYRIRALDVINRVAYSNVVSIRVNKTTGVMVWPNPFVNEIRISYNASAGAKLDVKLVDNAGRIVKQAEFSISRGQNSFAINGMDMLSKGNYFLRITNLSTGEVNTEKLIK